MNPRASSDSAPGPGTPTAKVPVKLTSWNSPVFQTGPDTELATKVPSIWPLVYVTLASGARMLPSMLCMLMVVATGTASAGDKSKSGEKPQLFGELAAMVKELKLDADTQSKLADVAQQREEALAQWDKTNSATLAQIKKASTDAHEAGNNEEAKSQMESAGKLQSQRKAIESKFDTAAFNILTPDQQTQWLASKMVKQLLKSYKTIVFSDEQKTVISSRASVMIQNHQNSRDEQVWAAMLKDLRDSIDKDLLTPEQTAQLLKALDGSNGSGGPGNH